MLCLKKMGVQKNQLFFSSIHGYGIPQGNDKLYNYIRKNMNNDNLFVILMLSQNYYNSPVCLNEMGVSWIKQSEYQSILLPEFDYPNSKEAIDPRDMSFNLSDEENRIVALNELKDRIIAHWGLKNIDHTLWERFRNTFIEEVDQIITTSEIFRKTEPILTTPNIEVTTDDERIILYYIFFKKIRKVKKKI